MTAVTSLTTTGVFSQSELEWAGLVRAAPRLAGTTARYLDQISLSLRPQTVGTIESVLRLFCRYLVDHHPGVTTFAMVGRPEIEAFKLALGAHVTAKGAPMKPNTRRQRLGIVRTFFDRIIEWDWPDAPTRTPIFDTDLPKPDEPLPKALGDGDAARLAAEIAAEPDPLRRLVLELLFHTGLRVGELCALEADAVIEMGGHWLLRVPVGKLHNDRYVPLLPHLLELLDAWRAGHDDNGTGLMVTNDGRPLNRHVVTRMLNRVARRAGLGHLHPHLLRHTMATQQINSGMRLETIAAILGHRTLRMTIRYARIADQTVADEYHAAAAKVEALYAQQRLAPATTASRPEHHRMLANGWCTRPATLDCSYETICERCGFYTTAVEFKPTLQRQADHAAAHGQPARAELYHRIIDATDKSAS